jgi:alpha-aminoadipate/glutamate carrier protein LysW
LKLAPQEGEVMSVVQSSCPVCDASVPLAVGIVAAEVVACPDCGSELEVRSVDPPLLAEAPTEAEDWGQ